MKPLFKYKPYSLIKGYWALWVLQNRLSGQGGDYGEAGRGLYRLWLWAVFVFKEGIS